MCQVHTILVPRNGLHCLNNMYSIKHISNSPIMWSPVERLEYLSVQDGWPLAGSIIYIYKGFILKSSGRMTGVVAAESGIYRRPLYIICNMT